MKTINDNQNTTLKLKRALARKRVPSMLTPFTEQLLQMDTEQKTLKEMMEWLEVHKIKTSDSTLSDFLISRRRRREMTQQLNVEKDAFVAVRDWVHENPDASLEALIERFKMLALSLSMTKEAAPEVLKLADRLAWTASRVANDQSREDYRSRKLVMEEAKHAEWKRDDEAKALDLCLKESDKYPQVSEMFTAVFVALKQAKEE
jgi:hypothetical protein